MLEVIKLRDNVIHFILLSAWYPRPTGEMSFYFICKIVLMKVFYIAVTTGS
jgi:hypothetical protein